MQWVIRGYIANNLVLIHFTVPDVSKFAFAQNSYVIFLRGVSPSKIASVYIYQNLHVISYSNKILLIAILLTGTTKHQFIESISTEHGFVRMVVSTASSVTSDERKGKCIQTFRNRHISYFYFFNLNSFFSIEIKYLSKRYIEGYEKSY